MVVDDDVQDAAEWVSAHKYLAVSGESSLGPMIGFSRMCRLYADLLAAITDSVPSLDLIGWLELEWRRWRIKWLDPGRSQRCQHLSIDSSTQNSNLNLNNDLSFDFATLSSISTSANTVCCVMHDLTAVLEPSIRKNLVN